MSDRYNEREFTDPHAAQRAKQAARVKLAGEGQAIRMQQNADRGGQSPLNRGQAPITQKSSLTPQNEWGAQFSPTLKGAAERAAWGPKPAPSTTPPAINYRATTPAPQTPAMPAPITPPASIVPQGTPGNLQPGQGWKSPEFDPRSVSRVNAPDRIQESVGSVAGKGGGNILGMYRPNVYNTFPSETPNGVVHNNPQVAAAPHPAAGANWQQEIVTAHPNVGIAGTPENLAFVAAYKKHNDPVKAYYEFKAQQDATASQQQQSAALATNLGYPAI